MNGDQVHAWSKEKNGAVKLSKNFKVSEFACKDGSDTVFISQGLVTVLQKIRDHFGKPVIITSAYRNDAYNKKVGGAVYSQHKYGAAADIFIIGVSPATIAAYVETIMPDMGGIGIYSSFVHVDVRADRARWNG